MYFKQIYVKIVKMAFKKSDCHDNDIIVFLDELYKFMWKLSKWLSKKVIVMTTT